ncbi:MAG: TonB-dependent receptor [Polyangiaceae bacterium]
MRARTARPLAIGLCLLPLSARADGPAPAPPSPPLEEFEPEPGEVTVDVIEVVTQADTTSSEGQMVARKKSAASTDAMGRGDMAKASDKNAAEATKRVVGATLEGSRFVFVRGLGARYTNALLDGAPLPSPEPDQQAITLDLFPSSILDGVSLVKTFTPDVPGDFAGGSIRIKTRRYSDEWTLVGSLSLGLNTQSSFASGVSYEGGDFDFLAIDDGARGLPEDFPEHRIGRTAKLPDGTFPTKESLTHYTRELNSPMRAEERITPPNASGSFVVSKGFDLGKARKFGFLGALTYDRKFEVRNEELLRSFTLDPRGDGIVPFDEATLRRGTDKVTWGALGGLTYEAGKDHRLSLTGLYSRSSDKETVVTRVTREGQNLEEDTRLGFVERALGYGQLRGEHDFPKLDGAHLDWSVSLSRATRHEPDRRGLVYAYGSDFGWQYADDADSGSHLFSTQGETTVGASADWTQPLRAPSTDLREGEEDDAPKLKFGGAASLRAREQDARRFRLKPEASAASARICPGGRDEGPDPGCVDAFFARSNMGKAVQIDEVSRLGDQYDADLNVFAGYVMVDTPLGEYARLVVGPRLEASFQSLAATNPVNPIEQVDSTLDQLSVLPALALVVSPTKTFNLRASLTRTVARPQLREIAPFSFTDYFAGRPTEGNLELRNTSIVNADVRAEWFPDKGEVLAVSSFFKHFDDPIEQVVTPEGDNGLVTFQNASGARLFGMEFELRKSLGVFAKALKPFTAIANVTLAHSLVDLDPANAALVTHGSRALSLQAPYIVNLALDWAPEEWGTNVRLSYNVVGKRITQVGLRGLPDVYEQPRHQLDVAVSQKIGEHVEVKGAITNLVDSPVERTQGPDESAPPSEKGSNVTSHYTTGRTFSLGVGLSY